MYLIPFYVHLQEKVGPFLLCLRTGEGGVDLDRISSFDVSLRQDVVLERLEFGRKIPVRSEYEHDVDIVRFIHAAHDETAIHD
jgi:hypothetical protein